MLIALDTYGTLYFKYNVFCKYWRRQKIFGVNWMNF